MAVFVLTASLSCVVWPIAKQRSADSRKALTPAEFHEHMKQLADAWNKGDARVAADLFAEDRTLQFSSQFEDPRGATRTV